MAYIHDYTYASDDANVSSHTGELPNHDVGDLLVWLVSKDSATGTHPSLPSGWTSIYANQLKNEMLACYKFATSGETTPTTSSSDTDAWQSSMYAIKGANGSSPISTHEAVINTNTITYTTYSYHKPTNTSVGNLHFAFLSPSGVGGCSIENYGKRYINEETTSMGMVVHVNTITDTTDVPMILGASQHTNAGMLQFEIIDDGNNLSKPVCYNDFDIIELATDGMVNGSTLADTSLTTLDGLPVVAARAITQNGGDVGFYPLQKAPYAKGVKGLKYSAMEVTLSTSTDLSTDLFIISAYPYRAKYQPTIGYGTQGRFVYLMDASGNYKAFNIDSADNKLLNFSQQWSYVIDPTSPPFASVGTLDLTAVTKIGIGERSRSTISYYAFNRLYRYRSSSIFGGNNTFKASFYTLLEHQDGSYFRPNLLQGSEVLVQVPIEIGNGVVETIFEDSDIIIEYPANYDVNKGDYLFHQNANRSGINFNLTSTSSVTLNRMVLQGDSEWYFSSSNALGSIDFSSGTIKGSGSITLESNMHFVDTSFINNREITGTMDIYGSSFSSPKDNSLITLSDSATFAYNKFSDYSSKIAITIPASVTSITLNNVTFDHTGTDIHWLGTTGTLNVNLTNGSDASTTSSSGGTVHISNPHTFTLTGLVDNTEVRIYTSDLSTELFGVENSSGGTVSYSYDGTYDGVVVTIFNVNYDPIRLTVDLGSSDSSIPIQQRNDRWYDNPA